MNSFIFVFQGTGRNGKGVLRDLMAYALGGISETSSPTASYFHSIQASMLTHERPASSAPCPDLLNIRGKRFLVASEPEKGAGINTGFLKMLTGNDIISGRYCHGNAELHFSPQHSIALQCNDIPQMDSEDDALWTRGRIIEYPFKFTESPCEEHHRKIDETLKQRVSGWGPQFMVLLLEYYKKYRTSGLKPTIAVLKMSGKVRDDNDPFIQFVEVNLEKTGSDNDRIKLSEILTKAGNSYEIKNMKATTQKQRLRKAMQKLGFGQSEVMKIPKNGGVSVTGWQKVKWQSQ